MWLQVSQSAPKVLPKRPKLIPEWSQIYMRMPIHTYLTYTNMHSHILTYTYTGCIAGCERQRVQRASARSYLVTLTTHWTHIEYTLNIHGIYIGYALNVHWIYIEYTLNIHWIRASRSLLGQVYGFVAFPQGKPILLGLWAHRVHDMTPKWSRSVQSDPQVT